MELEQLIKELNNLVQDEQLTEIPNGLRYSISLMTKPAKYDFGKKSFENIKQEYINRFTQIL